MRGPAAVQGIRPGGAGPEVEVKPKTVKVKREKIRSVGASPEVKVKPLSS